MTAQQCGRTLLNTAELVSRFFDSSRPLEWLGVPTWNDYEEGSEVETGIDNCYTVSASITGHHLTWESQSASSNPTPATVDHFTVYYADRRNLLYMAQDNIPVNVNSLDLERLVPAGSWNIYVRMVGKPLFMNRISAAVLLQRPRPMIGEQSDAAKSKEEGSLAGTMGSRQVRCP